MTASLRRGLFFRVIFAMVGLLAWSGGVWGQELPPAPPSASEQKFDLLLSGHVFGLFPRDKDVSVGGSRVHDTDVRGTIGAGIKFELYPWFTKKIVGAEVEAFGFGGSLRAPRAATGSGTTHVQGNLAVLSTMYNVMLRYPGDRLQPYVGVGVGSSTGLLYNVNIQNGNTGLSGSSADFAFAYQVLGGLRAFVTRHLFLFGEYKYYVTRYGWDGEGAGSSRVTLDVRAQIVSGGVGWSF